MIEAIGPRKTAYADMKVRKLPADSRIFHGTRHQDKRAQRSWPRRMLIYCGASAVKSFAAEREFAEMLTPSEARAKEKAPKNLQARLGQWLIRTVGSHGIVGRL